MSKRERQEAILKVIREHRITSQEALRERLHALGIRVAQATLSRDIHDLRLVKIRGSGGSHYALPEEAETAPSLESVLPSLFVSAEGTRELLVVRTLTGGAQAVARAMDTADWPEVLGTIAGDDTILLVLRTESATPEVRSRILKLARSGGG